MRSVWVHFHQTMKKSPFQHVVRRVNATSKTWTLHLAALISLAGCTGAPEVAQSCDGLDAVLAEASFVLVLDPPAGARVSSPIRIRGCSRTFESNVVWELRGRDGRVLAAGNATGGGVAGAARFAASAAFTVPRPEVGQLLVFEVDASDGEGFPPSMSVLPLILAAGP